MPTWTCPECGYLLDRITQGADLKFRCTQGCGKTYPAADVDTLIASGTVGASAKSDLDTFVAHSAEDPANYRIRRQCPECPRDYMTQIYIGDEQPVYTCKCGYRAAAAPAVDDE